MKLCIRRFDSKFLNVVSCNQMKIICRGLLTKLSKKPPQDWRMVALLLLPPLSLVQKVFLYFCFSFFLSFFIFFK